MFMPILLGDGGIQNGGLIKMKFVNDIKRFYFHSPVSLQTFSNCFKYNFLNFVFKPISNGNKGWKDLKVKFLPKKPRISFPNIFIYKNHKNIKKTNVPQKKFEKHIFPFLIRFSYMQDIQIWQCNKLVISNHQPFNLYLLHYLKIITVNFILEISRIKSKQAIRLWNHFL